MKQDWDAKEYAKHSKGQEIWAKELIKKLDLKGTEDILDLGCGDGKITALLQRETHGKVLGIDKSEEMITLARDSYSHIEFTTIDATKLHFDNAFDIVFSNAVLHWIHDHQAVTSGLYRALRKEGKILLQFGGHGNAKDILTVMKQFIETKYAKYFEDFTFPYYFPHAETYTMLLEAQGFREINVQLIEKDMVHENIEAFSGWIHTTWFPYIHRIPRLDREIFINDFIQAYLHTTPLDDDGKAHVTMVRLEAQAIK